MDCPNYKQNIAICTCTYPGCSRKGKCCECLHYHRENGQLPGCFFSKAAEKTYDRSISRFIADQS